jgi:hypothetical protein
MQQAVERGLLNAATWPPTSASAVAFMKGVGLGVDCSGFVYRALMAADAALTAAGMAGLTSPQTTSVTNISSQQIGRGGGTAITSPGDLRVGDIIQMASNAVGHIRIITSVRAGPAFVEYDTAESTTRVGDGPQASTWRLPVAGPMDTSHLEVRNSAGTWGPEPSGPPVDLLAPARGARPCPGDARPCPGEPRRWGIAGGSRAASPGDAAPLRRARQTVAPWPVAKGTVRDVEGDLIPQQVAASARNLVAIVPQGTVSGGSLSRKLS